MKLSEQERAWLATNPPPGAEILVDRYEETVVYTLAQLEAAEQRLEQKKRADKRARYYAKRSGPRNKCFRCGRLGHYARTCKEPRRV